MGYSKEGQSKGVDGPKLANVTPEIVTDMLATRTTELHLETLVEVPMKTDRQLADYVWGKLTLAVSLACQSEQERRSGHLTSAAEHQREWAIVMAEVKRLSPLVRKSGSPTIVSEKLPLTLKRRRLTPTPISL